LLKALSQMSPHKNLRPSYLVREYRETLSPMSHKFNAKNFNSDGKSVSGLNGKFAFDPESYQPWFIETHGSLYPICFQPNFKQRILLGQDYLVGGAIVCNFQEDRNYLVIDNVMVPEIGSAG